MFSRPHIKELFAFLLFFLCIGALAGTSEIAVELPAGIEKPRESHWRDALAEHFRQTESDVKTEVVLKGGRCDVVTEEFAIEVDRANKWHEAIGQALHYALYLKKKPCIALFGAEKLSPASREALKRIAGRRKVEIIFLHLKTGESD